MYTFDWLAKQAKLHPNKTALIDAATDRQYTYPEFHLRASQVAVFLRDEWGIQKGDRVALLAHNSSDYFEILYGCAKIGALLVCLNWRLAVPELSFIMRDSTPKGLIYNAEFATAALALEDQLDLAHMMSLGNVEEAKHVEYKTAVSQSPATPIIMPPTSLDTPWFILYTSGTTGRPKGVIQTHGMVFYNTLNIGLPTHLNADDVTLNLLPFFHTGGLNLYTNPTLMMGGTAVIQRTFDVDQTFNLLANDITVFFGVPAVYLFLSQHPDFDKTDFSNVRSWACGGAPMPVSLLETYAKRGITIQQGFGMTETGPTVFLIDGENALQKGGSVGKPQLFVEVRIVDRAGNDVPTGEMGELLIKGPGVTPGYWKLPGMTAETITPDGWLHSGDVARCDEDGYYYIVDRWKDMYISGGENVYPAEVENVLFYHSAIAEVAIIGVPDPKWGEVGKAVVVLNPDESLTEADVLAYCQSKLAKYKIPKTAVFTTTLPRNAAGKVLKTTLREKYVEK
ncbi:MAG: long-chain fatty acid--CoA ligase [Chloroflexi bacterium]|nr:long-chain fatty acid--CoA ligase [Chloroflexota bacterium]